MGWGMMIAGSVFFLIALVLFGKAVSTRMKGRYYESGDIINCSTMATCFMLILLVGGALLIFASTTCG